jgi:hydrogenase nickel incorporation protein HypB
MIENMASNDRIARENRCIFDRHWVFIVNLMDSPRAGKTTLLEWTLAALKEKSAIAVIE